MFFDCSCCFKLFGIVQVVRLFPFVFGSAKLAALIQVVLVLSVVLVCSGLFFTIFCCLELRCQFCSRRSTEVRLSEVVS